MKNPSDSNVQNLQCRSVQNKVTTFSYGGIALINVIMYKIKLHDLKKIKITSDRVTDSIKFLEVVGQYSDSFRAIHFISNSNVQAKCND